MTDLHDPMNRSAHTSIIEALAYWKHHAPDETALTILRDGEEIETAATYAEVHDESLRVARALRAQWPAGTRVVLLLPTGVEFVHGFFGCLAAGMIAVPANHPLQPRKVAQWKKLEAIVANAEAELILAPARSLEVLAAMQQTEGLFARSRIQSLDGLLAGAALQAQHPSQVALPTLRREDVAFLQYTSGSTGTPKGVVLTHGNILNNQDVIAELMGHGQRPNVVSWLPLYHDMGLSALLQMASRGCRLVLMSPMAFIQRPMRWLEAISRFKAHTSGGPNFAYQLVAEALGAEEAPALDLASWQVAFCGAEPIQRKTVAAFVERAGAKGLRPDVFYPCYGLAESTVQVTGVAKGSGARFFEASPQALGLGRVVHAEGRAAESRSLVACGAPAAGNEVWIVHPVTLVRCADGEVGEIWIRGASVGQGYWNNEPVSREMFGAHPVGAHPVDDTGAGFLRTGDLGTLLEGQLYVTGRVKDMLIIRGRNLYPQDVEEVVQASVEGLRKGCGAVFSIVHDDEEKLVIVQEVGRTQRRTLELDTALRAIVAAVLEDAGVTPHQVLLVDPGTVEKTSSGKVARSLCREAYLRERLRPVAVWTAGVDGITAAREPAAAASASRLEADRQSAIRQRIHRQIVEAVATFLKLAPERVSVQAAWTDLGFDSMSALMMARNVEQRLGVSLDSTALWECGNIDELANHLATLVGDAAPAEAAPEPARAPSAPGGNTTLEAMSDEEATALLMRELQQS